MSELGSVEGLVTIPGNDLASDYGSDFDDQDLIAIGLSKTLVGGIDKADNFSHVVRIPKRQVDTELSRRQRARLDDDLSFPTTTPGDLESSAGIQYNFGHIQELEQVLCDSNRKVVSNGAVTVTVADPNDKRSPLQRFRTAPKKPLSVTDLTAPSWCELKYWYSLTKHGKVRRTPAMRQGSKIHKQLEEQVHDTVPVEIATREDAFALRMFNTIQGLRTLKTTGLTREFEVWGVVDGEVVNGTIDELTTTCPDPVLEARLGAEDQGRRSGSKPPSAGQLTLQQFLKGVDTAIPSLETSRPAPKVYIADVKTKQTKKLPYGSKSLRPVHMQLQLYHKLLSNLAAGLVSKTTIFNRFRLDANATFGDAFIAQIGGLDLLNHSPDGSLQLEDTINEITTHNTLSKLWDHMIDEFRAIMPVTDHYSSIGKVLRVEYRTADTGDIIGTVPLSYREDKITNFLADELAWWRGERDPVGVDIEDAHKCHYCEFAEICTWRLGKANEWRDKSRQRKESSTKSCTLAGSLDSSKAKQTVISEHAEGTDDLIVAVEGRSKT